MVRELIQYMQEKNSLAKEEWIAMFGEAPAEISGAQDGDSTALDDRAVDAYCELLDTNDFTIMKLLLEQLVKQIKTEEFSIAEAQFVLSRARNMILKDLARKYDGETLVTMLLQANKAHDQLIFSICSSFQKMQEKKFKTYLERLEEKVKEGNHELEESRSNYMILFEEINDGCFVNQNGRIVFANKPFCRMHAYERDEMIGMECQNLVADDSRQMVMKRFYEHLKGKDKFDTFIYCRQDKHGRRIPTENRIKLIKYKDKPAVLGLCTDITRRIEMEEKIKQKDRLALIGRLTTSIAHEIRNPLSAIKVNIQILLEKLNLGGNDLRRLQIAQEQSVLLESILSKTLQVAKPIRLDYSLTGLGDVIDRVTEFFEEMIHSSKVSVTRKTDPSVGCIMTDQERIIEALANVFKNALEAFDEDAPKKKRIEITAGSMMVDSKRYVRLTVKDNGKGIEPKDRAKIFEPFVTKGKKGGVGLGLSIVKRIVDAHNGYFDIESKVGEGTSFSFIIPAEITQ